MLTHTHMADAPSLIMRCEWLHSIIEGMYLDHLNGAEQDQLVTEMRGGMLQMMKMHENWEKKINKKE